MASTPWLFQSCPDTLEFRDKANEPNPDIVQKRIIRRFICTRIHTGVSSMPATAAGSLLTGTPSASVGSANITGSNISTTKWVCTSNLVEQNGPVGTDSVRQTQTWETYSPWEDFNLQEEE